MVNLLVGLGVLLGLLFLVWVVWAYHRYGKLKNISGVVTLAAIVASLPLGVQLVMERTRVTTQASADTRVAEVQVQKGVNNDTVVYVTLTDAGFAYIELESKSGKEIILSQGKVEPRIGHAFVIKQPEKFAGVAGSVFVDGRKDVKGVNL